MFANVSTAPTHPRTRAFLAPALLLIVLLATLAPTAPARASGSPAPFPSGAEVVAVTRVADRQVDLSVRSTALGGRTVKVRLLTPDGWDPSDRHHRRHWPPSGSCTAAAATTRRGPR
ncbi:Esterase family protein OS=Streptomyces parvulus OX=146923 GN=Spa2297_27585 PE=4 SV=1 [Streptomyces parvulus]